MKTPFVLSIEPSQIASLQKFLEEHDFLFEKKEYALFSAKKKGIHLTLYTSCKLTVQGKEADEFIRYTLEPFLGTFSYTMKEDGFLSEEDKKAHIGTDEAGKGDFFGPLVVAGVYIDEARAKELLTLGIKDSKLLSDKKICSLAPKITALCPNYIIRLMPSKYNELYTRFGNLNHLLAWCHATVIAHLVNHSHCHDVLVDKFAHESLVERALSKKNVLCNVVQRTKAESDLAVAAASCLARWGFLEGMSTLSKEVQLVLPKGSSSPSVRETGKKIVETVGLEALSSYAKIHFRLTQSLC